MSIVGPRPIVTAEISRYGRRFSHYCAVKPGITGLWQVSGRNDVAYRRRVAMDTIYARNKSLVWDIKLLLLTVPAVLFASGSY
jgi:exopolysaccharide production protein ExoY